MIAATPTTEESATMATPISSPAIIKKVRLSPTLMPKLIAKVMHIPGVTETKKKVGINNAMIEKSIALSIRIL